MIKLPKHCNPRPERTASAPYNFIPLPETVVKAVEDAGDLPGHDEYLQGTKSGYFEVKLFARSPLYVRCPFTLEDFLRQERDEDKDLPFRQQVKNTPHFFYTRDPGRPVIPGSSLRGMLRSLLEIVSYGKVQWVTGKQLIYRAVGDQSSLGKLYREKMVGKNKKDLPDMHFSYPSPLLKGGYLCRRGGGWEIQPAKEIKGESFVRVEHEDALPIINGQGRQLDDVYDVFVKPVSRMASNRGKRGQGYLTLDIAVTNIVSPEQRSGLVRAKLVKTGYMGGAHPKHWHCAIYEPDFQAKSIPIPFDLWKLYEEDRDLTRGIQTRKLTEDGDPVFYLLNEQGNLIFFGPTMMFRLPYNNSPLDCVPVELRRLEDIDYAEALFGFVRTSDELDDMKRRGVIQEKPKQGDKRRAYAGRVYVTDAEIQEGQNDIWLSEDPVTFKPVTPKILASPKPTAFQHYLVQTNEKKEELKHYDSKTPEETVIRGHKRYWLQGERGVNDICEDDPEWLENGEVKENSKQHTQFRPVKPGVRFKFRVYFENLSERELGALCWVLHPLGDENKDYCHQIGMGKPLGMGAVKLEAVLHLIDRNTRYASLFEQDNWQLGTSLHFLSERQTMEKLARKFEEHVISCLNLERKVKHLYEVKRIAMLLKMMEWPGLPPVFNGPLFLRRENTPNTRYMKIRPNEYHNRPVLPDPSAFGPLAGDAEPVSVSGEILLDTKERKKVSLSESVDSVNMSIKALRGPGEISRVPEIVKKIEKLNNPEGRRECAEMLQQWLKRFKLWEKEPHAKDEWHKKLEKWLY